ncbi:MAG: hypothetical protein BroJett005_29540 [Ignavibacteriota bacterium]|nr:MAG: hypothetical protein BroJett005_29540 [Ignavibacteriota bacterium]
MNKTVRIGPAANPAGVKRAATAREKRVCIAEAVESIVGCKWSLQVLSRIRRGVTRPGALVRACPGLSTKVLNERLTKMIRFGILERVAYPEVPPRVEYRLTPLGGRFVRILDAIDELQSRVDQASTSDAPITPQRLASSRGIARSPSPRESAS